MAAEFRLADIGEGLAEAEVVRWLVSVGEQVTVDQPLVEVETAKSVVELPSPYAGTVLHLGAADGDVLTVGEIVAVVGEPGDTWPAAATGADAPPIVGSLVQEAQALEPVAGTVVRPQRVLAVPLVRKLARELGVDLLSVSGTAPQGRITRDDVQAAAQSRPGGTTPQAPRASQGVTRASGVRAVAPAASAANGRTTAGPSARDGDVRRPLSRVRRTIAANLGRAWSEIPMVTAFDDLDVGRLLSARRALAECYHKPVPLDAMLVAAVLPVLRVFPEFNSSLDGDDLVLHGRQDIGLAVDTPDGLLVAVLADASAKSLPELADEVVRLGERARARELAAAELTGQTFTVSNIGAIGAGGYGTPLVPPGTTAILSVGRAADKPVVRDGRIEVARLMPVSLSYDHRVIDGATGRRFLAALAEMISEPVLLLA